MKYKIGDKIVTEDGIKGTIEMIGIGGYYIDWLFDDGTGKTRLHDTPTFDNDLRYRLVGSESMNKPKIPAQHGVIQIPTGWSKYSKGARGE